MARPEDRPPPTYASPSRRRSVGFLEHEGESWSCFLVTFAKGRRWYGYFSFRRGDGETGEDEVRTADIFREDAEATIDLKARALGRPLLGALLASALHTHDDGQERPRLRRWFRELLAENSRAVGRDARSEGGPVDPDELRSLYASYRLDQVAHFIALLEPEHFQQAVERILEGQSFDFGAKDRIQFAMIVVDFIEERLPLPPFEVWAEDYVRHARDYQLYAHTLHREGRLP